MDYRPIHELIDMMNKSDLYSLEIESSDIKIKMKKGPDYAGTVSLTDTVENSPLNNLSSNEANKPNFEKGNLNTQNNEDNQKNAEEEEHNSAEDDKNIYVVKSPMVGTFYSSSGPDKEPFVSAGAHVKSGDVICIIEAMKLMNEIECEKDGIVKEILVNSGDMVEYGQELMKIEKA